MQTVYLDNNATTRTDPDVVAAMLPCFNAYFANTASHHRAGKAAAAALATARRAVARLIGAEADEIVFTSGGTEADNLALAQAEGTGRDEIVVSAVEHPAILATCRGLEARGMKTVIVGVDHKGRLDIDAYRAALSHRTALVSLMWANNETGTLFPIAEIAAMAKQVGALFHSDAVQAAGRIAIAVDGLDFLSISAHKLHGPKGIGALFVRRGAPCAPFLRGGRQERGRRAGTQNLPGIVGFGVAAELVQRRMAADAERIAAMRDRFEAGALRIEGTRVLGDVENRLPGTCCLAFDGADGEMVLDGLDRAGICASSGAACASGAIEPSHVVRAMAVPEAYAHAALRFSFSRDNTESDVDRALAALHDAVNRARTPMAAAAAGFF